MSLRGSAGQPTHWLPVSAGGLCEAWRGLLYVEEGEGAITSLPEMGESFTGCLAHSLDLGRVSYLIAHIKSILGLISHNIHNKWIFNDHKSVIMGATINNIRSMMRAMPGLSKGDLGPVCSRCMARRSRVISSRSAAGLKRTCGACSIQWAASTRILMAQIRSLLVLLVMIAFTAQAQTPDTRPDFLPAGATFVDGKIVWETDLQIKVSAAWEAKAEAEMDAAVAWETLAQGHDAVSAAWEAAEKDPRAWDAIDSLIAKMSAQQMEEAAEEADSAEAEAGSDWREWASQLREWALQARESASQEREWASQSSESASQARVNDSWTKEQAAAWRSAALNWREGASQADEWASQLRGLASVGRKYASALQEVAVDVAKMFQAGSEVREATAEAWEVVAEANEATAEAWEAAVKAWEAAAELERLEEEAVATAYATEAEAYEAKVLGWGASMEAGVLAAETLEAVADTEGGVAEAVFRHLAMSIGETVETWEVYLAPLALREMGSLAREGAAKARGFISDAEVLADTSWVWASRYREGGWTLREGAANQKASQARGEASQARGIALFDRETTLSSWRAIASILRERASSLALDDDAAEAIFETLAAAYEVVEAFEASVAAAEVWEAAFQASAAAWEIVAEAE